MPTFSLAFIRKLFLSMFVLIMSNMIHAKTILILGDSLSSGYGLPQNSGWVDLLKIKLTKEFPKYQLINASMAGSTVFNGLSQLPSLLQEHNPDLLIIQLGVNDSFAGLPIDYIQSHLSKMILLAQAKDCKVLLLGIRTFTSFGEQYAHSFENMYVKLAKQHKTFIVPRFDAGVTETDLQSDGIHPTQEVQPIMMQNVWKVLLPILSAETKSK